MTNLENVNVNVLGHMRRAQAVVDAGLGEIVGVKLHLTGDSASAMEIYNGYQSPIEVPTPRHEQQPITEAQEA